MKDILRTQDTLRCDVAAWLMAALALWLVLRLHLLAALLSGLLVYELVHIIAPRLYFGSGLDDKRKLAAVALVTAVVVVSFTALIFGAVAFFRGDADSLPVLLQKMAEIIESSRTRLPDWAQDYMPGDAEGLKLALVDWLREHASEVQVAGKEAGLALVHILVGMVIGALVSLRQTSDAQSYRPLARALAERVARLAQAFRRMVFAQVRIAALNTLFTGIYLSVVLPFFGVRLPLTKTMLAITFVAGLVPVVGNLISNSVIVVVSLSHSLDAVVGSLAFLIVVHKFEYFLNARIVGEQIHASAWELLLAMLVMEAAFGIAGVVAAPVYYAYLKGELADRDLI